MNDNNDLYPSYAYEIKVGNKKVLIIENVIYGENVKEQSVTVVDRKQLEDALEKEKKRRQDTDSGVETAEFNGYRQVTLSDLPGYEGQL